MQVCKGRVKGHADPARPCRRSPAHGGQQRCSSLNSLTALLIAATLAGCDKTDRRLPSRPVRSHRHRRAGAEGETVSLTGQVRAKDQVSLAFRLDGRMIERPVNVGDVLKPRASSSPGSTRRTSENALRSAQGQPRLGRGGC